MRGALRNLLTAGFIFAVALGISYAQQAPPQTVEQRLDACIQQNIEIRKRLAQAEWTAVNAEEQLMQERKKAEAAAKAQVPATEKK